jgi:hypothetical protein
MFPKWQSRDYARRKQARLTIQAHRSGKEESMETNAMFGHWEFCYMKCVPLGCPLLAGIFLRSIEKSLMGPMRTFLSFTLMS